VVAATTWADAIPCTFSPLLRCSKAIAPNAGVRIIPGPWIQAKNLCSRICPWGVVPGIFGAKGEKPALVKYIPAVAAPSVAWRSRPEAVPCRPAAPGSRQNRGEHGGGCD